MGGPPVAGAALLSVGNEEASGGGAATVAEIKRDRLLGTLGRGIPPTIVDGIVPDGVARITIRYLAGKAGGFSRKTLSAAAVTAHAVNNVIVVAVPRAGLQARTAVAIWRAANGTILKVARGTIRRPWWIGATAP